MSTDIDQFLSLREQLASEYEGIDQEIVLQEGVLAQLRERKHALSAVLGIPAKRSTPPKPAVKKKPAKKEAAKKMVPRRGNPKPDPNVDKLLKFLKERPGSDRTSIRTHFKNLDDHAFTLMLGKCSKRGLIVNKGIKRQPLWAAV